MNPFFLEQMAMYSAYHRSPKNRATHFVGVPAIVLGLFAALARLPLGPINAGILFLLFVSALYLWFDYVRQSRRLRTKLPA